MNAWFTQWPDTLMFLWAQAPQPLSSPTVDTGSRQILRSMLPIVIIGFAAVFFFILWAVFFRKTEKPRVRGRLVDGPTERTQSSSRRHRRRRREKNRPRNPTLSETGGLPPVRDPNSPPPSIP